MNTSKFTTLLAMIAALSGVVVGIISWLVNPHAALALAVISIGLMITAAYWRLRNAQATTTNMAGRLADQISSLHSRTGSQFNALTSQLSVASSQQASKVPHPGAGSVDLAHAKHTNENLGRIYKRLEGQQALLQEILVALDLEDKRSK